MKAFDQIDNKITPDEEFNKQAEVIDTKLKDQKETIEKEQQDTNKGLKIEMRNQTMCPIMRVEFPNEIVEEIKNLPDQEALDAILQKITKTYLKKAYDLEKMVTISEPGITTSGSAALEQLKIVLFTDNIGSLDITWGSADNYGYGHDLYPKIYDSVPAESGVMLIIPAYADLNLMRLKDFKLWGAKF